MNYFEFKQILDANPHSQNPDFLAAKNNDRRCNKAYQAVMYNEWVIKTALEIPVPTLDIAKIKFSQAQLKQANYSNRWWALAASLLLMFSTGLFFFSQSTGSDLEKFINDAMLMEPAVYMSETEIPQEQLAPLFASIDTAIDGSLGKVHFMKLCPTLNGNGARMVLMNELNQPITVLYMPNSPVDEAINMQMQGFEGKIVALEQGSAAIISRPHESTVQIENILRNTLKPIN
jgi:hypothetical protein